MKPSKAERIVITTEIEFTAGEDVTEVAIGCLALAIEENTSRWLKIAEALVDVHELGVNTELEYVSYALTNDPVAP